MKNILLEKTTLLAVEVIRWGKLIPMKEMAFMQNQLYRSCTSVGAHVRESNSSKSKNDFVNKLKSAYQELDETEYWIQMIESTSDTESPTKIKGLILECKKIINSSISTSIKNSKSKPHP
jgi:four helix bundle protein